MTKIKNITSVAIRLVVVSVLLAIGVVSCVPDTTTPSSIEGKWSCKETHSAHGTQSYNVNISFDAGSTSKFKIYNFLGLGSNFSVNATLNGNSIVIAKQTISSHEVSGSGTVASGSKTVTLNYTDDLYGDVPVPTATATYTR